MSLLASGITNVSTETANRTWSAMSLDCVVRNGKVVIPHQGIVETDIGIKDGKIAQIGNGIADGEQAIDASGKHVFPGCVDTHTHYGHFNEFYHEMETESVNLASLGVTTSVILLDRCVKNMEGWHHKIEDPELFQQPIENVQGFMHAMFRASYDLVVPEAIEKSEQYSANDFAFHLGMLNPDQIEEIPHYYQEYGVASVKFWTAMYGKTALNPSHLWAFLSACKASGVLPYINTVNFAIQDQMIRETAARAADDPNLTGARLVKASRGARIIETLDLQSTLWLAREIGSPQLCIAHVTSGDSVMMIRRFREEYGLKVDGEAGGVWLDL
jgi:dihydroorotase-like cyclic amidohydrolase